MATEPDLLVATFHMLKNGPPHEELGTDSHDRIKLECGFKLVVARAGKLGVALASRSPTQKDYNVLSTGFLCLSETKFGALRKL